MASFDKFIQSSWTYLALALFVLVAALPGLVSMPALDRDESRFSQASSQMMETGDYVVIRYHEGLRNKKPVGIHWMQAAAVSLTSSAEARDIGAFRLPSLIGAMIAAMATFWGGSALFNRRAAFIGAALLGSCLLLTTEAHIAKTDAALCGAMCLMMAALARMRTGSGNWKGLIFWICMAVGVLLKGIISPMIGGLAILALFAWERKIAWARPLLWWPGLSLFCILTIPWFIAVQIATGGEFLWEAAAVDLGQKIVSAAEGHEGPPGMHLLSLPILFWPGTLLLVPGLWLAIQSLTAKRQTAAGLATAGPATRTVVTPSKTTASIGAGSGSGAVAQAWAAHEAGAWRFLICWAVPAWIIFELAPTKLVHYTLPIYPAFALMAGAACDQWMRTGVWTRDRWVSLALFAGVSLALAALASPWALAALRADAASGFAPDLVDRVTWIWAEAWRATNIGLWPSLLILITAGGTIYAFVKKMPLAMLGGILACSLVGGISYRAVVLPNQTWMLPTVAAMDALTEICALPEATAAWAESGCEGIAPKKIQAIAYAEPSLVFELGGKIVLPPKSVPVIPSVAEDNRPAWIINIQEPDGLAALGELTKAAAAVDRCIRFSRRYVLNYSNGDPHILVAAVVEPDGCVTEPPPEDLRPVQEEEIPELED